jgi:hypothetical protein
LTLLVGIEGKGHQLVAFFLFLRRPLQKYLRLYITFSDVLFVGLPTNFYFWSMRMTIIL